MDEKLAQGRQRLHNMLHDDASQTDRLLTSVETGTGIAREHFVFAIVGIVAVYFLTGEHGQMASNTICLIVPNIVAYHAVRAGDSSKFGVLLVYWMTYAIIRVVDIIIVACDPHFLSIYWLLKTIGLLLLLFIPYSAQRIYNHFMATTTKEKHSKPAAEQQSPITGDIKAGKSIEQEPKSIAEEKPLSEPFPLPVVAAEKEEEEHTAIVEEVSPLSAQPVTDGEPLKAEETEDNKPYIKDEARNEIGLLNQCSDHILEEECPTVASTTHSSTTPASAETTIQQPSQLSPTGVGQQQEQEHQELQEDTDKGGDDGAHSEQSPSASTNMSEQPADIFKVLIDTDSNTPQSPENPQPYAPTPAEVVAVDQSSSKVDSEACPLETSRSVHDILNDSSNDSKSGGNDRTPTTALSLDDSTTTSRGDQPTDSIDPSSDGDLLMEPNGMLVFNAPFLEQALVYPVRLMNTCQFPIGYAIKSNALPHLSTDREFGVMPPGESVLFAVSCAPFSYHLENRNNDCITIEYVGVPLGVDDVDSDWFVDKGDCVVKRKNLLVQYNS